MSSNRLMYDTCAYKTRLDQSTSPLQYHLNPMKYENCNKCRIELGATHGPSASQIKGNLVDLENELRGQTRLLSSCDNKKYKPGQRLYTKDLSHDKKKEIDTNLVHLPSCQMIRYKPIPLPNPIKLETCNNVKMKVPNSVNMAPPKPACMSFN
jgi:hypothetical protein